MSVFDLTKTNIVADRPSGSSSEYGFSLDNVVKFSIENKGDAVAYLDFYKGTKSLNIDIPKGEVREFEAATGFKYHGTAYLHWDGSEGDSLIIKQVALEE